MTSKVLPTIKREQFNELQKLGFDWFTCRCGGFPDCLCEQTKYTPCIALVIQWLREERNIFIFIQ